MGWNDVRVTLVPVGWKIVTELDFTARTAAGDPVAVLHSIPDADVDAPPVDQGELERRLGEEGFAITQRGETFLRMNKAEIEALIAIERGMVSEVILTFTLDKSSPSRAPDWQRLTNQLIDTHVLALFDHSRRQPVRCHEFLRVLTESPAWRQFAKAHAWPEIASEYERPHVPYRV